LTEKCSNPTFTTKLDNRRLKLEILAANTTLSVCQFIPEVYDSIMEHISITNIQYIWFFFSSQVVKSPLIFASPKLANVVLLTFRIRCMRALERWL